MKETCKYKYNTNTNKNLYSAKFVDKTRQRRWIEHVLIMKVYFERRKTAKVFMTHVQDSFQKSLFATTFERKLSINFGVIDTVCSCYISLPWQRATITKLVFHYTSQFISAMADLNCWPDCKPEGPLFSAEFVCLCVSDRHFYPSTLTDFDDTWSQGPYCDLVWPRP